MKYQYNCFNLFQNVEILYFPSFSSSFSFPSIRSKQNLLLIRFLILSLYSRVKGKERREERRRMSSVLGSKSSTRFLTWPATSYPDLRTKVTSKIYVFPTCDAISFSVYWRILEMFVLPVKKQLETFLHGIVALHVTRTEAARASPF